MNETGKQWYVIRSKPHKEQALYTELLSRKIETYYPQLRVNPVNPRSRKWVPYFPGYMFVHIDIEETGIRSMHFIPYSIGLVVFGDTVPIVPDTFLVEIDQKLATISKAGGQTFFDIQQGDKVKLIGGSFEGYEAIFQERLNGNDRVRILCQMLTDHSVSMEVEMRMIKKIKK